MVTTITAVGVASVAIIGATVTGIVKVLSAIRGSAKDRDEKLHEIHVLVNNRLTVALRALVMMLKREAERSGTAEDRALYEKALEELRQAEAGTELVARGVV